MDHPRRGRGGDPRRGGRRERVAAPLSPNKVIILFQSSSSTKLRGPPNHASAPLCPYLVPNLYGVLARDITRNKRPENNSRTYFRHTFPEQTTRKQLPNTSENIAILAIIQRAVTMTAGTTPTTIILLTN